MIGNDAEAVGDDGPAGGQFQDVVALGQRGQGHVGDEIRVAVSSSVRSVIATWSGSGCPPSSECARSPSPRARTPAARRGSARCAGSGCRRSAGRPARRRTTPQDQHGASDVLAPAGTTAAAEARTAIPARRPRLDPDDARPGERSISAGLSITTLRCEGGASALQVATAEPPRSGSRDKCSVPPACQSAWRRVAASNSTTARTRRPRAVACARSGTEPRVGAIDSSARHGRRRCRLRSRRQRKIGRPPAPRPRSARDTPDGPHVGVLAVDPDGDAAKTTVELRVRRVVAEQVIGAGVGERATQPALGAVGVHHGRATGLVGQEAQPILAARQAVGVLLQPAGPGRPGERLVEDDGAAWIDRIERDVGAIGPLRHLADLELVVDVGQHHALALARVHARPPRPLSGLVAMRPSGPAPIGTGPPGTGAPPSGRARASFWRNWTQPSERDQELALLANAVQVGDGRIDERSVFCSRRRSIISSARPAVLPASA